MAHFKNGELIRDYFRRNEIRLAKYLPPNSSDLISKMTGNNRTHVGRVLSGANGNAEIVNAAFEIAAANYDKLLSIKEELEKLEKQSEVAA